MSRKTVSAISFAALLLLIVSYNGLQAAGSPASAPPTRKPATPQPVFLPMVGKGFPMFNPPGGSGGITRTPFQMTQERPPTPDTPYQDIAYILKIDYVAKTMQVSIRGSSGPTQSLSILSSVDIGTATSPNVVPGNWAIIQRIRNQYFVTGYQVYPNSGNSLPATLINLPAPQGWSIVQIGDTLYASWSPVSGALAYSIYQNTTPSPVGAVIANNGLAVTSGTSYTWIVNTGTNSNLITVNPGYESGNLAGWTISGSGLGITVSTANPHSGSYSLLYGPQGVKPGNITSNLYPVTAGQTYTWSFWIQSPSTPLTMPGGGISIGWWNSSQQAISGSQIFLGGTVTSYTQEFGSVVAPAGAAYASFHIDGDTVGWNLTVYIDDWSLVGAGNVNPVTNFYAVNAIGEFPGQVSPFTVWLQPTVQTAALGPVTSAHLQQNPLAPAIHSSTLAPAIGVAISPNGFTDTGWNVPLISAINAVAETWTYASATSFTNTGAGDATSRYFPNVKLRLKQGGAYLYYTVTSASYSAPNTTVNVSPVAGGASLSNAAITDNYYSYEFTPQGFPYIATTPFNYLLPQVFS